MAIDTVGRKATTYFIGTEVERTVMYGERTLFVVGVQSVDKIVSLLNEHKLRHVYLGTSQSFTPSANDDWQAWNQLITALLDAGYWVTLDFGVEHIEGVLESAYNEYPRFVPMISVKLPYINQLNYNATLKLDDRTWGATNPGVWTHHLQSLMSKDKYTHWDQYTQDTTL